MTLVPYELRKLIGSKLTVVLVLLLLAADIITCAVLNKPAELPDSAQSLIPAEELEKEEAMIALGEEIYAEAPEATLAYYLEMDAQVQAYDEAFMDYVVNSHKGSTAVEPEEPIFAHMDALWELPLMRKSEDSTEYLSELKSVASGFGISPEYVDHLLEEGFTTDEIEEYIYCGQF